LSRFGVSESPRPTAGARELDLSGAFAATGELALLVLALAQAEQASVSGSNGSGVKSGPLWISQTGEQKSVRSLGKIVSAAMNRAGIEDSAHALRHTVATRLVRDHRHDLVLVADILGHADVKTTRHYARSGLEDQRAALEDLAD
jgi:site-specific recombinase XerD